MSCWKQLMLGQDRRLGSSFDMINEHFLRIYHSSGRFSVSACLERVENLKLFYYLVYFYCYLWILLNFLVLFISSIILF